MRRRIIGNVFGTADKAEKSEARIEEKARAEESSRPGAEERNESGRRR